MTELFYKSEVFRIVGAAMEVHKVLGCGFLEGVYQDALELEFKEQNIPFEREQLLNIYYKGAPIDKKYMSDFICFGKIVVELKALSALNSEHESQLINYLKATKLRVGVLLNFGTQSLEYKRLVL